MTSPVQPIWTKLPLQDPHLQPDAGLFVKITSHAHGLQVQATDLAHLWTAAQTSRSQLEAQATTTLCSVDASQDDEQYGVLTAKLSDALHGRHGATIQLHGFAPASTPGPVPPVGFSIQLSLPLPPPLAALEWTFRMVRQEPVVLAQELLLPALRLGEWGRRREEDLRRRIREKDHVIGKLVDRLEGSGADLGMVFPGLVGGRKGRSARGVGVGRTVPGLKPFREEEWERMVRDGYGDGDGYGKGDGVWGIVDGLRDVGTGELLWNRLGSSMPHGNDEKGGEETHHLRKETTDDHQPQSSNSVTVDDDSSESPEIPDATITIHHTSSSSDASPAPPRSREVNSKHQAAKLGKLGGKTPQSASASASASVSQKHTPPPPPSHEASDKVSKKPSPATSSTDTATEPESEPDSHPSPARPVKPSPSHAMTRMGIIGGRKPANSRQAKITSPEPLAPPRQSPPSHQKSKLGVIGGRRYKSTTPPAAEREHDSTVSPTPSPPPHSTRTPPAGHASNGRQVRDSQAVPGRSISPSQAEEPLTEAERANRKRQELKRQLDQGTGGKKKRRF